MQIIESYQMQVLQPHQRPAESKTLGKPPLSHSLPGSVLISSLSDSDALESLRMTKLQHLTPYAQHGINRNGKVTMKGLELCKVNP